MRSKRQYKNKKIVQIKEEQEQEQEQIIININIFTYENYNEKIINKILNNLLLR